METAVCCATRGDAGAWPDDLGLPPGGIGEQREQELRDAAQLLGVGRIDVLGYADSGMDGAAGASTLVGAPEADVAAVVRRVLAEVDPHVVVTLDATDGHRDHARIRDVTVAVAREAGVPVYLHCLAQRFMRRWAELMAEGNPASPYLSLGELGTPDGDIDVTFDTSAHYEQRETAIAAHRSQTSPFEGLPAELRREWLSVEHLVGPVREG